MPLPLIEYGATRRCVFYDELSNFNPTYASPTDEDLWPLEAERRYHLRNLRLLSLYFDNIVIMTGNIMNFTNHTTKAIVLKVISDKLFIGLIEQGIIVFCGWGTQIAKSMIHNQIDYANVFRPELKDRRTVTKIRDVISGGDILVRDERYGEDDFFDLFVERLRIKSEAVIHKDWERLEQSAQLVNDNAGYLGTLEFFPCLGNLDPTIKRLAYEVYLDSWIDYSTQRYYPVQTYESPRFQVNPLRTTAPGKPGEEAIASILLSPQFFEAFLLRFLSRKEYYRLLTFPLWKLALLRNGDWLVFTEHYHTYLRACSDVLWQLQISSSTGSVDDPKELFERIINDTIHDLPGSFNVFLFTDFLAQAIGFFAGIPGLSALVKSFFKPMSDMITSHASRIVKRFHSGELYPFISKIRAAVAA